jgi:hypothetical protein
MLKELRGSDVIIECLLEQGVDTVFGYPGGAVLNIYDSLYKYSDSGFFPLSRSGVSVPGYTALRPVLTFLPAFCCSLKQRKA